MMKVPLVARHVANVEYTSFKPSEDAMEQDSLRIDFKNGERTYVPNGDWSSENPALCVIAFLGAKPSNLDAAEDMTVPVAHDLPTRPESEQCSDCEAVTNEDGNVYVHDFAIHHGSRQLENAEWFLPEA